MRVGLHVGQLFQRVPGGIGRVIEMLCAELPERAHVVAFASGSRARFRARVGDPPELESFDSALEFRSLGPGSPRWHYAQWHRFRGLRLDLDVDVCHAPSLAVPPSAAPLVVTVNDVAFLRHPERCTRHGVRFHERGLALARREAQAIIVPSEFTRWELMHEGFDRSRIHCVPLGVRVPDTRPRPDPDRTTAIAALCRRGVRAPYLLAAGTLEPRKDHATLLAAFARVRVRYPEVSLVVAGAMGWLPTEQARLLERPGVVVLGAVPDPMLDALYDGADAVVSTSIYEGFGLTVLEGLAHGRPVVATKLAPHCEIAGDDAALFFAPGDADGLTARLAEVLGDPGAAAELGRAGRERARAFDVASMIDGHVAVYERAVFGGV